MFLREPTAAAPGRQMGFIGIRKVLETQARQSRAHHQAGQFWLANYDSFPDGLAV